MMDEAQFWLAIRQALLAILDALERWRGIEPRTAEIRRQWKQRFQ